MITMLKKLSDFLSKKNIVFDPSNQHVRCLAHIINLAAKKTLENLYESYSDNFDEIEESQEIDEAEEESDEALNIIYKVSLKLCRNTIIEIYILTLLY
jgi:hypothetical protein